MRFGKWLIFLFLLAACSPRFCPEKDKPALRLIGDSTMANKPAADTPERGWGQLFDQFFKQEIQVVNYAKNGRSSKSFIREGRWDSVLTDLKPGDYLFIQFGHNDAKISDSTRYAGAHTAYRDNLIRFVAETRAKNAFPILLTPVARRSFSEDGVLKDGHGDYPAVVREVANLYQVPLIDMHASSMQLLSGLGAEKSEPLFMRVPPGFFNALPNGKSDNTHFMEKGAATMAGLVAAGLKDLKHPLCKYLLPESKWPDPPLPPWPIPLQDAPNP